MIPDYGITLHKDYYWLLRLTSTEIFFKSIPDFITLLKNSIEIVSGHFLFWNTTSHCLKVNVQIGTNRSVMCSNRTFFKAIPDCDISWIIFCPEIVTKRSFMHSIIHFWKWFWIKSPKCIYSTFILANFKSESGWRHLSREYINISCSAGIYCKFLSMTSHWIILKSNPSLLHKNLSWTKSDWNVVVRNDSQRWLETLIVFKLNTFC